MFLRLLVFFLAFTTPPIFAQTVEQVVADTVIGFGTLRTAAPSPDGKYLLTGGGAGVTLWDTATWENKRFRLPESANTESLAWDARGRRVASFDNGAVHLWNAKTQKLLKRYEQEFFADTVRLSPSGDALAYVQGFRQRWVKVYNPRSSTPPVFEKSVLSFLRREPEPLQPGAVHSFELAGNSALYLEFTSDTSLLSVSSEGVVQEADFNPDALTVGLGTRSDVRLPVDGLRDVAFDAAHKRVAALTGDTVTVWSYPKLRKLASRRHPELSGVALSRDGRTLVAVDSGGNGLRWRYEKDELTTFGARDPYYHSGYDVLLSRTGDVFVRGLFSTLDIYRGGTLRAVRTPLGGYGDQVFGFRLASDEKSLVVEAHTDVEKRHRLPDGELVETVPKPKSGGCGGSGSSYSTADRRFTGVVPSGMARQFVLYRADTCEVAATLTGAEEPVGGLVVSANERYALLVSFGSADVWSLETGRKLFSPKLLVSVPGRAERVPAHLEGGVFSPDERRVSVLFGESAVTYDLRTRKRLNAVRFSQWGKERLDGLALSPDGRRMAGSSVGDVIVWDYPAGPLRYELTGHTNTVHAMTFLRSGKQLVTGSADGTVRLWSVP